MLSVSFPRTGHSLLFSLLASTQTGQLISQSKVDLTKPVRFGQFRYCEFYTHCQKVDCTGHDVLQKHHDFDLALHDQRPVLFQLRNPWQAIESYYELEQKRNCLRADRYEQFALCVAPFFVALGTKWLFHRWWPGWLVSYEALWGNTEETVRGVCQAINIPMKKTPPAVRARRTGRPRAFPALDQILVPFMKRLQDVYPGWDRELLRIRVPKEAPWP